MDKLSKLIGYCKCGIDIYINEHKIYYESAEFYIKEQSGETISNEIRDKIIESDTVINIIFFPRTPVCSVQILHYDLDQALTEALEFFENEQN